MDQVSLPGPEAFLRVTEVPGHLTPPQPVRWPGDSPDLHPSTRQVDEEEHQEPRQPLAPPGLEGEEIRRHPHLPRPAQELLPSGFPLPLRRRFQPVLLQKVGDGAAPHLMPQMGQSSLDSPVTPIPVLGGPADHQPLDLLSGARTAWASLLAALIFSGD